MLPEVLAMVMAFHSASLAVWSSCRVLRQLAAQFVLRRAVERILSLAGAWRLQDGEILVRVRDSATTSPCAARPGGRVGRRPGRVWGLAFSRCHASPSVDPRPGPLLGRQVRVPDWGLPFEEAEEGAEPTAAQRQDWAGLFD